MDLKVAANDDGSTGRGEIREPELELLMNKEDDRAW